MIKKYNVKCTFHSYGLIHHSSAVIEDLQPACVSIIGVTPEVQYMGQSDTNKVIIVNACTIPSALIVLLAVVFVAVYVFRRRRERRRSFLRKLNSKNVPHYYPDTHNPTSDISQLSSPMKAITGSECPSCANNNRKVSLILPYDAGTSEPEKEIIPPKGACLGTSPAHHEGTTPFFPTPPNITWNGNMCHKSCAGADNFDDQVKKAVTTPTETQGHYYEVGNWTTNYHRGGEKTQGSYNQTRLKHTHSQGGEKMVTAAPGVRSNHDRAEQVTSALL